MAIIPLTSSPPIIAIGFKSGHLAFVSLSGVFLFIISPLTEPVVSISTSPAFLSLHSNGLLVRITPTDLERASTLRAGCHPPRTQIIQLTGQQLSTGVAELHMHDVPPSNAAMLTSPSNDKSGHSHFLAAGASPYLSLHRLPPLEIKAAMSSVTSSFFSLFSSTPDADRRREAPVIHHFSDSNREAYLLLPIPWRPSLALVTDSLGRVTLVHTPTARILRMWKGYREAEIAWLSMDCACNHDEHHELHGSDEVHACKDEHTCGVGDGLVVLHAPRRGLVEVWDIAGDVRVAAVQMEAGGRLIRGLTNAMFISKEKDVYLLQPPPILPPDACMSRI